MFEILASLQDMKKKVSPVVFAIFRDDLKMLGNPDSLAFHSSL